MMSGRAAANILTRATAVLAALFIGTSLVLAMMAGGTNTPRSVVDEAAPVSELMPESAAQPPEPEEPAVPLSD
jgi:preprotein translocase subunit SecG